MAWGWPEQHKRRQHKVERASNTGKNLSRFNIQHQSDGCWSSTSSSWNIKTAVLWNKLILLLHVCSKFSPLSSWWNLFSNSMLRDESWTRVERMRLRVCRVLVTFNHSVYGENMEAQRVSVSEIKRNKVIESQKQQKIFDWPFRTIHQLKHQVCRDGHDNIFC